MRRVLAGAAITLGMVAGAGSAQALGIYAGPGTPEGYVTSLSGASDFGLTDGTPGGTACPLCDSTVNFATYSNADRSDWRSDLGVTPSVTPGVGAPAVDSTARWVFFYQIENTDPLGGGEELLENFNVTATDWKGDPLGFNPYTSIGFIDGEDVTPFASPVGLDVPNDGVPSVTGARSVAIGGDDVNPTDCNLGGGIASDAVRGGSQAYEGGLCSFSTRISTFSDVIFLTSNFPTAKYVWAETESRGGFGAAGDVPGVGTVPVPASALLLLPALGGLAALRRRRRAG